MLVLALMAAAAAVAPPDAAAGPAAYSPGHAACIAAADTVIRRRRCVASELQRQQTAMNAAFRGAQTTMDEAAKAALREGQRAWVVERDRGCVAEMDGWNDEVAPLVGANCLLSRTSQRAATLQAMAPQPSRGTP